jgi:hypothetical protein
LIHWIIASVLTVLALLAGRYVYKRTDRIILRLLENGEWWTGKELVKAGKLNAGSIYIHLYSLEEEGRIVSVDDEQVDPRVGIVRRRYHIA